MNFAKSSQPCCRRNHSLEFLFSCSTHQKRCHTFFMHINSLLAPIFFHQLFILNINLLLQKGMATPIDTTMFRDSSSSKSKIWNHLDLLQVLSPNFKDIDLAIVPSIALHILKKRLNCFHIYCKIKMKHIKPKV